MAVSFFSIASATISSGVCDPSEHVECICRSQLMKCQLSSEPLFAVHQVRAGGVGFLHWWGYETDVLVMPCDGHSCPSAVCRSCCRPEVGPAKARRRFRRGRCCQGGRAGSSGSDLRCSWSAALFG